MSKPVISHAGATIDQDRLAALAFNWDIMTDNERQLVVALQDALTLANIFRGGHWTEHHADAVEVDVTVTRENVRRG